MKKNQGTSLLELMLALALSILLINVVIELYLSADKINLLQNAMLFIEENQQMTHDIFKKALHLTGFIGCAKLSNDFPIVSYPPYYLTATNKITPYTIDSMKPATEAMTIRSASQISSKLIAIKNKTNLEIMANQTFNIGNIALIANCQYAELFKIKNIFPLKNNILQIETELPLQYEYSEDSEIMHFEVNSYFIAKTNRTTALNKPIYALYKIDITGKKSELVEGVDNLHISYDYRQMSNDLAGVSIKLLFSSVNAYALSKEDYLYVALY